MSRFFVPVLFLLAAAGVYGYNATHPGQVIGFLWLPAVVPSLPDNPERLGQLSWQILLGVGALLTLLAARNTARDRALRRQLLEDE